MKLVNESVIAFLNEFVIKPSKIHGVGLFATKPYQQGERISMFIDKGIITENGKLVNHSYDDNFYLDGEDGTYYGVASKNINIGEELISNYDKAPYFIENALDDYV
jgi:SET domain-containing protein